MFAASHLDLDRLESQLNDYINLMIDEDRSLREIAVSLNVFEETLTRQYPHRTDLIKMWVDSALDSFFPMDDAVSNNEYSRSRREGIRSQYPITPESLNRLTTSISGSTNLSQPATFTPPPFQQK